MARKDFFDDFDFWYDDYVPMDLDFVVRGYDEEKKLINPVPYKRTTQGGTWDKGYKKYQQWKAQVQACCIQQAPKKLQFQWVKMGGKHIIDRKAPFWVRTVIFFKDRTHSDPDNVHKGINDALFKNDKYVSGEYWFFYDIEDPRVEVSVRELHITGKDTLSYESSALLRKTVKGPESYKQKVYEKKKWNPRTREYKVIRKGITPKKG